jgi:hypothetical protein
MIQSQIESSADRRRAERASITIAVKQSIDGQAYLCQASNISAQGIFLSRVFDEFFPGQPRCLLEFSLPGSREQIVARGQIVRQSRKGRLHLAAVRFFALFPTHQRLIDRYVGAAA